MRFSILLYNLDSLIRLREIATYDIRDRRTLHWNQGHRLR
jgi:hypothetical protein